MHGFLRLTTCQVLPNVLLFGCIFTFKVKLKTSFTLRWGQHSTSIASSMSGDDGDSFQDLRCDEPFVLSDHEDSLSEAEDDSENEPMYETETDEG